MAIFKYANEILAFSLNYPSFYPPNAKFRMRTSMEEIDFFTPRGLDKTQLLHFADGSFLKHAENILITWLRK
jgi:hypothetical protein